MLTTKEWEHLNELIASLYGIRNSTAMRKAFLTKLMDLIAFDLADFNLSKQKQGRNQWLEDPVVVSIFSTEMETEFTKLYETEYYKMDYVSWIFAHHESIAYRESDLINRRIRKESRFYKEYLARYDLGSVAGVSIISTGSLMGAVTLYKSESKGDFSKRDVYILEMLLPHLQNVLGSRQEQNTKEQVEMERLLKYQFGITKKEKEIMRLILQGRSNREIAEEQNISANTVKSHIAHIFEKTGVKSRTQLICFLIRHRFFIM